MTGRRVRGGKGKEVRGKGGYGKEGRGEMFYYFT